MDNFNICVCDFGSMLGINLVCCCRPFPQEVGLATQAIMVCGVGGGGRRRGYGHMDGVLNEISSLYLSLVIYGGDIQR